MKDILLIQGVKIHNANALSSPYTIGFPAMTAWLGFMHALERKLSNTEFSYIKFSGLVVSCLDIKLQTRKSGYTSSIIATGNPLDKHGNRPSFIEEARADLEVSIGIECGKIESAIDDDKFKKIISKLLHTMKIASGDITRFKKVDFLEVEEHEPQKLTRYLMPGFCLVSRQDLVKESMESGQDAIDAILDYLKTTTTVEINDNKKITMKTSNKTKGWLVPISMGFQGISELSDIKNSRDNKTQHRFAESIVTLGEFKMPYRFDNIDEMMWRHEVDTENNLYLCKNNFKPQPGE